MIEINLLPPEMRKVDRTSLKRLVGVLAALALLSGSAAAVTISLKAYRAEATANVANTAEVARLEPIAKEYDALLAAVQAIQTRIDTIEEIRSTRVRWGRKLDQLYVILPEYVWFEKIELKNVRTAAGAAAAAQAPTAGTLVLDCQVAGADETRYSELCRVLTGEVAADGPYTGKEFYADFVGIGYSGWTRQDFPATEEGVALKFSLELPVKAPTAPRPVAVAPPARQTVTAGK